MTATFAKDGSGQWMIRIAKTDWAEGAEVAVTLKNGTTKTLICGDWFEQDGDHYLASFTDPNPKPARKAAPRRASARTSGNAATVAQRKLLGKLIARNTRGGQIVLDSHTLDIPNIDTLSKREASDLIALINDDEM